MDYVDMINDTIEYIENNIKRHVSLNELAERRYVSCHHFYRIFRALTHKTIKQYTEERRLTEAAKQIKLSGQNIIEIAFDYGFESHEVFTRSFKRHFGITPIEYRKSNVEIAAIQRIQVVEREFKNFKNDLAAEFTLVYKEPVRLLGLRTKVNPGAGEELAKLQPFVEQFVSKHIENKNITRLYNVTSTDEASEEQITYFTGYEPVEQIDYTELTELVLPGSHYAVFRYQQRMLDIHKTVFEDICRAVLLSGYDFNMNGIDFFELYEEDYYNSGEFSIYVPLILQK